MKTRGKKGKRGGLVTYDEQKRRPGHWEDYEERPECPSWYVLSAAFVLGCLTVLVISEVRAVVAASAPPPAPQLCVSASEVISVLSKVGHTDYWPRMREQGLDRLDIISSATQADAAGAGIKPFPWMRIVVEANAVLTGKRGGAVPANALPEDPEPPVAAPVEVSPTPEPTPAPPPPPEAVKSTPKPPAPVPTTPPPTTPAPKAKEEATPPPAPTPEPIGATEIVLPPNGTQLYYGVPEGHLLPEHALKPSERPTVTCVADNGLGDRLGTLFDAVWLAYLLDANFHVLWNMNNECRARFGQLFSFNGTHVSTPDNGTTGLQTALAGRQSDFDAVITLAHHRGSSHLVPAGQSRKTSPGPDKQWLSDTARVVSLEKTGDLVSWAKARLQNGLRVHILHHSDRLAQGVTFAGIKTAMQRYGFRLRPAIWNRVVKFTRQHDISPTTTVGIHLRATDARIPLMLSVVKSDVRQHFPGRRFFVCSDDPEKEDEFVEAFRGRAVKNTMKTAFVEKLHPDLPWRIQGRHGSERFNVNRGEMSVIDALTDMCILSRTEKPQVKGSLKDSSFGKMSSTLCILGISCDEKLSEMAAKLLAAPGR